MHTLRLPPRELWRAATLALALTVALLLAVAALKPLDLGSSDRTAPSASAPPAAAVDSRPQTGARTDDTTPAWVKDPLAPPSLLASR